MCSTRKDFNYLCHLGNDKNAKIFNYVVNKPAGQKLTHWDQAKHISDSNLTTIGSDNGLSPRRHQAIIWNNAEIIVRLGTNFNEILMEIHTFLFMKMHLKMSSGTWRPFCLGLNALMKNETKTNGRIELTTLWEHVVTGIGDFISFTKSC